MKKKTIANTIMIAIIFVILAAGVLGVGHIRGWFDTDDGTQAVLGDIVGLINLERDGVSYTVEKDIVLRQDDKITCESGATAMIRIGENTVMIGESAALCVTDPSVGSFAADVIFGQLFTNCDGTAKFTFEGHTAVIENAVALLSVRSGAQSIAVLAGTVEGVEAGNSIEYLGEKTASSVLQISTFGNFALTQIRKANETATLCVTNEELDRLEADRLAALQDAINNAGSLQPMDPTESTGSTEPGHVHSYVDQVVAPTCADNGYTSHTCSCGDSYKDAYTDAVGHTWGDWVTAVQPTTDKEGTQQRQCSSCGATEKGTLARLEAGHIHNYIKKTVTATCTTGGYTLHTCSCGVSYKDNEKTAKGHNYTDKVTAPTCTADGYTQHTCSCGDSYTDTVVKTKGHSWSDWKVTKQPTTSQTGLQKRTCAVCKITAEETLPMLEFTPAGYVYITIRCDTILDNWDELNPAKAEFVPADGVILPRVKVAYAEGETVFDILVRVCATAEIQLEYSWEPLYDAYYIEGINNLYQFDCSSESGWMYKVNEWFPNYGVSAYTVSDGDVIEFLYTCHGYGTDVGAPEWTG